MMERINRSWSLGRICMCFLYSITAPKECLSVPNKQRRESPWVLVFPGGLTWTLTWILFPKYEFFFTSRISTDYFKSILLAYAWNADTNTFKFAKCTGHLSKRFTRAAHCLLTIMPWKHGWFFTWFTGIQFPDWVSFLQHGETRASKSPSCVQKH